MVLVIVVLSLSLSLFLSNLLPSSVILSVYHSNN
jgi:hypothetical protein